MEDIEIVLPKLGESIVEATVVSWFKNEGDFVDLDEPLLEVSTDKVNSEIPAPSSGYIKKIIATSEQLVKVGEPLAILSTSRTADIQPPQEKKEAPSSIEEENTLSSFYSPAVLRLANEQGISMHELESIPKTGVGGRISKKDVEKYIEGKKQSPSCSMQVERVKMNPMRKLIAENMVRSFYEAPHASLVTEVDVTNIVKKIQKEKQDFQKKYQAKLSITAVVAQAITKALHAYPLLNASLENDTIVIKKFINLGIAVSVEQGVLVPIIHNCEHLKLPQISQKIGDLAEKARTNRLSIDETQSGTITLTNFGVSKVLLGIPIIRHCEVAIIGLGAITKKVVVLEDDIIGIRSIVHISLTFDHRVLDGMYGCGFLQELKRQLETVPIEI